MAWSDGKRATRAVRREGSSRAAVRALSSVASLNARVSMLMFKTIIISETMLESREETVVGAAVVESEITGCVSRRARVDVEVEEVEVTVTSGGYTAGKVFAKYWETAFVSFLASAEVTPLTVMTASVFNPTSCL